jgi:hypothetical protein
MQPECERCTALFETVDDVLDKLVQLTSEQLAAFRAGDQGAFMRLDKELELTVGSKERSIGALREHRKHHLAEINKKAS